MYLRLKKNMQTIISFLFLYMLFFCDGVAHGVFLQATFVVVVQS